ncbi:MAG: D-alanine--D-alanine ligase [Calditrichaceae bacterium]
MKIVVLMGGDSTERDVSLVSGDHIAQALSENGHTVIKVDPAGDKESQENLNKEHHHFITLDHPDDFTSSLNKGDLLFRNMMLIRRLKPDLVFNALHGGKGENGIIQSMLDSAEIKYTGSGRIASMIAMDKDLTKTLLRTAKLPTPRSHTLERPEASRKRIKKLEYPQVVKPNDQGSTIGLGIVNNYEELENAIDEAFKYSSKVIIEEYVPGREITVGVVKSRILPVIEIAPKHGLYDYECKYSNGMSEYIVPAELSDEQTRNLQNIAFKAHILLGCKGYSRVDFRLTPDGEPYILEVNTLPGMTGTSLLPKAAKAVGINFNSLVEMIIEEAISA